MPGSRIGRALRDLPAAFLDSGSANADAIFLRFKSSGDRRDLNRFLQCYLPLVTSVCLTLKRRRPEFYCEDLDILVSDGCLGLLRLAEHLASGDYLGHGPLGFVKMAQKAVRWRIKTAVVQRMRQAGRCFSRQRVMDEVRARLFTTLGRAPTGAELTREMAHVITNPAMQIGHAPMAKSLDVQLGESGTLAENVPAREREPAEILQDRELMRLVLRGMDPVEKRVFKMVLRGDTLDAIGRAFGVSRQRIHQRLNGLLWTLQRRADVAEYLGKTAREEHPNRSPINIQAIRPVPTRKISGADRARPARKVG